MHKSGKARGGRRGRVLRGVTGSGGRESEAGCGERGRLDDSEEDEDGEEGGRGFLKQQVLYQSPVFIVVAMRLGERDDIER